MDGSSYLIKKVSSVIEEGFIVPMWGKVPEFPWDALTEALKEKFGISSLALSPMEAEWKESSHLLEGFGEDPVVLSFVLAPLAPPFFFAINQDDIGKLSSNLLDEEGKKGFSEKELELGFLKFNFLQILKALDHLKIYEGLSPKLHELPLKEEKAYCTDVKIWIGSKEVIARLILPSSFHQTLLSHFASKPLSLQHVDSSIELLLTVHTGSVTLSSKEWATLELGDLLILDQCSYQPATRQGTFTLTLTDTPLFIVKGRNHELKILDYALYEKEEAFIMEENPEDAFMEENEAEVEESPVEEIIAMKDVSLSICVEVGRLKMPLHKILSLKPGNTIELPISVDQGVTLTVGSKPVAKGELIQLGNIIGVKISEITH